MKKLTIREAGIGDRKRLVEMVCDLRQHVRSSTPASPPVSREVVEEQVNKYLEAEPYHLVLLAKQEESVIGFIRMNVKRGNQPVELFPERKDRNPIKRTIFFLKRFIRYRIMEGMRKGADKKMTVYLADVYVEPGSRRKGVAKAMLDQALARLQSFNAETMYLWVAGGNQLGQSLFTSLGFEVQNMVMVRDTSRKSPIDSPAEGRGDDGPK